MWFRIKARKSYKKDFRQAAISITENRRAKGKAKNRSRIEERAIHINKWNEKIECTS